MIDNAADFTASLERRRPGTELRLRVLSGGREIGVAAVLGERQNGGLRPATRRSCSSTPAGIWGSSEGLAFTPDGRHIVSAGDDKVIRVWDWRAGTTVRSIRGQAGAGPEGKVHAMALSPDGRWLAVGGWTTQGPGEAGCGDIRLYEFATGRLVGLLKGHTSVVAGLAFAPDGKRLISGSSDKPPSSGMSSGARWPAILRATRISLRGRLLAGWRPCRHRQLRQDPQAVVRRRRQADRHPVGHEDKVRVPGGFRRRRHHRLRQPGRRD